MTDRDTSALIRWMPAVFVLIWATGFIVARYGMPHAPPFTFLLIRYLLSIVCFGVWIAIARVRWPQTGMEWIHLGVTGALMHGGMGALLGPTGGYIVGFLLICPIYGLLCRNKAGLWAKALALFLGLLACYAFGTLWFVKVYGDTKGPITLLAALSKCVFPFILPDLAKLALALWAGKRLEKYRQ